MIELMFLKELILITQVDQKSAISVTIWYFLNKGFAFQSYFHNRYYDLLMLSMKHSDIAILKIKNARCCCIVSIISKSEAINLMQNFDLTEKKQNIEKAKYQEQF